MKTIEFGYIKYELKGVGDFILHAREGGGCYFCTCDIGIVIVFQVIDQIFSHPPLTPSQY